MSTKNNSNHVDSDNDECDRHDEDVLKFINFMKKHFCKKDSDGKPTEEISHTLMGILHPEYARYRGSFHISKEDYGNFIELYKNAYMKMEMHLVERPQDVGPMVIDVDFNLPNRYKERQYGDDHIETIIKQYNKLFKKYLKNLELSQLTAFVFENAQNFFVLSQRSVP